jgi:hypothetical protein
MAAMTFPELPEASRTGTPDFPKLPAPPLGGGRNGNDERGGEAGVCRDARRELQSLESKT